MEIKIETQTSKPLLSREEFIAVINEKKTPSNASLKEEISKKLNAPVELIIIKKIDQKYGQNKVEVNFYIYGNIESLKKFENEKKIKIKAAPAATGA